MKKYAIGLAAASLFGVGISQASNVLIPYIKSGGNWVSLVSYTAFCPNYPNPGCAATITNKLHFIYFYKKDWDGFTKIADANTDATDGSYDDASCKEYNVQVPATSFDFTTVDVSISNKLGLTNNVLGMEEGYDGGNAAPSNTDFVLEPDAVVDAYLLIQDTQYNTATDIGLNSVSFLSAEAVVFDTVTGMFFYQYGIDVEQTAELQAAILGYPVLSLQLAGFIATSSTVMFQGEDFATTSVYYIPMNDIYTTSPPNTTNATIATAAIREGMFNAVKELEAGNRTACLTTFNEVYDRKEDAKSGTGDICVKCLALVPVKYFMSDSTWNKVKNGGGMLGVIDQGGVTYKGEVYKIGTKPNIFAPLKTYSNSLDQ